VRSGSHLPHVDFDNDTFNEGLKTLFSQEGFKEYYSSVSFLVPKYGIEELYKLYKKHKQFKSFEMITE
jgi:hypothetical protein